MIIDRLKKQIKRDGITKPEDARRWLISKMKKVKKMNRGSLLSSRIRQHSSRTFEVGRMYMFSYDPKLKETLPYYDKFPLVFPIQYNHDGFLGINLHYLPPTMRAILIDRLVDLATNKKFDDTTRLKLSYSVLASTTKYRAMKPCIKRYLFDHIESKFILINADEWDIAIFLPLERFHGAHKTHVHRESRKMIK